MEEDNQIKEIQWKQVKIAHNINQISNYNNKLHQQQEIKQLISNNLIT